MNILKAVAAVALLTTSVSAHAWGPFSDGPFGNNNSNNSWNNNGFSDMFTDMVGDVMGDVDFSMHFKARAKARGDARGNANSRYYGYNQGQYAPYYGYAPYGYAPVAAPVVATAPAPVAEIAK